MIDTDTGATIPSVEGNRDWDAYQAWVDEGNTADPAPSPALADHQAGAKASLRAQLEFQLRRQWPTGGPAHAWLLEHVRREAVAADADGSPTAGEYPYLNARAEVNSTTIAAEATAELARIAQTDVDHVAAWKVYEQALVDVDAAASVAAVDAVLAAVLWPGWVEPDPVATVGDVPAVSVS